LSVGFAAAWNPIADASRFQNVLPGDRTMNYTLDGGFRRGRVSAQSALYGRTTKPSSGAASFRGAGGYAQTGFHLVPSRWEVAARYGAVEFGSGRVDGVSAAVREYTVGVNRYLRAHSLKLQADAGAIRHRSFSGVPGIDYRVRLQAQILF
jgi:phosphate-selective porin